MGQYLLCPGVVLFAGPLTGNNIYFEGLKNAIRHPRRNIDAQMADGRVDYSLFMSSIIFWEIWAGTSS